MLVGEVVFHFRQMLIRLAVIRFPFALGQQEAAGGFHFRRVVVPVIPQHILDPFHPGLIRQRKQFIDGNAGSKPTDPAAG